MNHLVDWLVIERMYDVPCKYKSFIKCLFWSVHIKRVENSIREGYISPLLFSHVMVVLLYLSVIFLGYPF